MSDDQGEGYDQLVLVRIEVDFVILVVDDDQKDVEEWERED